MKKMRNKEETKHNSLVIQLLFNNQHITSGAIQWYDGRVLDTTFDDFVGAEEGVDSLHVARFSFSCRIDRAN